MDVLIRCVTPSRCNKSSNCRRNTDKQSPAYSVPLRPYPGGESCSGFYADQVLPLVVVFKEAE